MPHVPAALAGGSTPMTIRKNSSPSLPWGGEPFAEERMVEGSTRERSSTSLENSAPSISSISSPSSSCRPSRVPPYVSFIHATNASGRCALSCVRPLAQLRDADQPARPFDHHLHDVIPAAADQRDPRPRPRARHLADPLGPGPGLAEPAPGHQQPHGPLAFRRHLAAMRLPPPLLQQPTPHRLRQPAEEVPPHPLVRPAPRRRLDQQPLDLARICVR